MKNIKSRYEKYTTGSSAGIRGNYVRVMCIDDDEFVV